MTLRLVVMKLIISTWDVAAHYLLYFGIRRLLIYGDNDMGILLVTKSFVSHVFVSGILRSSLQGYIVQVLPLFVIAVL
jgi:hypothetical protein